MSSATHLLAERFGQESADFLLEFLDTPAPSGFEGPAATTWARFAQGFAEVAHDDTGNQMATVNRQDGVPRVAVYGHLDEIGFIVRSIDKNGLLKFGPIGGWENSVIAGQRIVVETERGPVVGTVGQLAPHQVPLERRDKRLKIEDLWIDIGAASKDEAQELVRPGDPIVLDASPHVFANGRMMSRSADNRLGSFIALEVARRCQGLQTEVTAVANATEEIDGSGALVVTARLQPDVACVVDVTFTADVPGEHDDDVVVGKGPAITVGGFSTPALARELIETARAEEIPFQLCAAGSFTGTDADGTAKAGGGVPSVVVSIPTRYLHSPGELFDLADVDATIQLIVAWVRRNWQTAPA